MIKVNQVWALKADPKTTCVVIEDGARPKVQSEGIKVRFPNVEAMRKVLEHLGPLPEAGQVWQTKHDRVAVQIEQVIGCSVTMTHTPKLLPFWRFFHIFEPIASPNAWEILRARYATNLTLVQPLPKPGSKWFRRGTSKIFEVLDHGTVGPRVVIRSLEGAEHGVKRSTFYTLYEPVDAFQDMVNATVDAARSIGAGRVEVTQYPSVGQWWRGTQGTLYLIAYIGGGRARLEVLGNPGEIARTERLDQLELLFNYVQDDQGLDVAHHLKVGEWYRLSNRQAWKLSSRTGALLGFTHGKYRQEIGASRCASISLVTDPHEAAALEFVHNGVPLVAHTVKDLRRLVAAVDAI